MDDLIWALMQKWGLHFCQRRRWSFCRREVVSNVLSEARTRHVILSCRTLCCQSDKLPSVWFQVVHFVMETCDKSIWSLSAFVKEQPKKLEYHEPVLFLSIVWFKKWNFHLLLGSLHTNVSSVMNLRWESHFLNSNYRGKKWIFPSIFSFSEMQQHVAQVSCCSPCSAVGNVDIVSGWIWRDCEQPFNSFKAALVSAETLVECLRK